FSRTAPFETYTLSLHDALPICFAPHLRIEPQKGKMFDADTAPFLALKDNPEVRSYSEVIEDKVLIQYESKQYVGLIKGVSPESLQNHHEEEILQAGQHLIEADSSSYALIGAQIQANLHAPSSGLYNNIQ